MANAEQQRWTLVGDEFTFNGTSPKDAAMAWAASYTSEAGNPLVAFRVEVRPSGGAFALVPDSGRDVEATNRQTSTAGLASFPLNPGDTVRMTVANLETVQGLLVNTLQIRISAM